MSRFIQRNWINFILAVLINKLKFKLFLNNCVHVRSGGRPGPCWTGTISDQTILEGPEPITDPAPGMDLVPAKNPAQIFMYSCLQ